jgi:hypothetical protein
MTDLVLLDDAGLMDTLRTEVEAPDRPTRRYWP